MRWRSIDETRNKVGKVSENYCKQKIKLREDDQKYEPPRCIQIQLKEEKEERRSII